ncbi:unnamed protein product, partial [Clonostachys rosea]
MPSSLSTFMILRFCTVVDSLPIRPGIFFPGRTRLPLPCEGPVEPMVRWFLELPEAVALHTTSEAHTPRVPLDVDVLADLEPIGLQLSAHGQQTLAITDLEFVELRLGSDALGLVVSKERAGDVPGGLGSDTDLDGVVAVLLVRLVGHDLDLLELQHRAGHAVLADEHARHALLGGQHAGPQRR